MAPWKRCRLIACILVMLGAVAAAIVGWASDRSPAPTEFRCGPYLWVSHRGSWELKRGENPLRQLEIQFHLYELDGEPDQPPPPPF